jgi:hypothetical protein
MVHLMPMDEVGFRAYLNYAAEDLVEQYTRTGNRHPTEALQKAAALFRQVLPERLATGNQHLFSAVDQASGAKLGMIWLVAWAPGPLGGLFVCDVRTFEPYRRRGTGAETLLTIQEKARGLG